ncbi:hypothetical protein FQ087_03715 [Sporosarcina sp. ANT_H38]|uniref:hypothetical protein n=1 Tax=Sporosarcina sp. ANT_H38 TaxID=2597358 RepID=UPI0011F0C696|nr:hypothetical protein [Sporosarcina sp. ANT_H38]KAA0965425.1 hypothetical protein FQ087_03715 [Sporosarcina sp. ANT_H38]
MKKLSFFDWEIHLQDDLMAVTDTIMKRMVILEGALELTGMIWIDEHNEMQIKPTWDCVISINVKDMILTIQHSSNVFSNKE